MEIEMIRCSLNYANYELFHRDLVLKWPWDQYWPTNQGLGTHVLDYCCIIYTEMCTVMPLMTLFKPSHLFIMYLRTKLLCVDRHLWSHVLFKQWDRPPCCPPLPVSPSSTRKSYEKKQTAGCECQDSECTLPKCYLGFGNCGFPGIIWTERQRERVREGETREACETQGEHTYIHEGALPLTPHSQRHYLRIAACWGFNSRGRGNLVAFPSIRQRWHPPAATVTHTVVWALGTCIGAKLIIAQEWEVFYSFSAPNRCYLSNAALAAAGNLN